MTTVSEIAAEMGIDPKRARRIMRKSDFAHEPGTAWELDANGAKRVRKILSDATGQEVVVAKPAKKTKAEKVETKAKTPRKVKTEKVEAEPVAA